MTESPFEYQLRATSHDLGGIDVHTILDSIGKLWQEEERVFECNVKEPFIECVEVGPDVMEWVMRVPCQDHVRFVTDPRDKNLCMCVIEPYQRDMDCFEELITFCKDNCLIFTVDGESSHFPGACIRIVIKKRME